MLTPSQVVPYLSDADPIVAEHAWRYLDTMGNVAPVTGDEVWRAIDAVDAERGNLLMQLFSAVPPTDASMARVLEWGVSDRPATLRYTLLRSLLDLDPLTLARHRAAILAAPLPPHLAQPLRWRMDLVTRPIGELLDLWHDAIRRANAVDDKHPDIGRIDAIAEALVHLDPSVVEEAARVAADPDIIDWREVFATRMLGLAPHPEGVRLLVDKLRQEDGDYVLEAAQAALPRLGSVEAVQAVAEAFPREGWVFRLYGSGALERINRPECEAAMLRLLEIEESEDIRTNLAYGLCLLCSQAAIPVVADLVKHEAYDPQMVDLGESLCGAAAMLGLERPQVPAERVRTTSLLELNRRFGAAEETARAHWLQYGDTLDRFDLADEIDELQAIDEREPPLVETFVRDEPRIGRNDPCPCGSGKKYKKCCLGVAPMQR